MPNQSQTLAKHGSFLDIQFFTPFPENLFLIFLHRKISKLQIQRNICLNGSQTLGQQGCGFPAQFPVLPGLRQRFVGSSGDSQLLLPEILEFL